MTAAPLAGKTVVATRGEGQASALEERLAMAGAHVLSVPALRFADCEDHRAWEAALARRSSYTHILFTSQVAARYFRDLTERAAVPLDSWRRQARVGAIGRRTAVVLSELGMPPDLVARGPGAAEFARELIEHEGLGPGSRVLLPQSDVARSELAEHLRDAGAAVDAVPIYSTVPERAERAKPLLDALANGVRIDAVAFASPSALGGFLAMTGAAGRELLACGRTRIVAIGPTTARAIAEEGFTVSSQAARPGVEELVAAVVKACNARPTA